MFKRRIRSRQTIRKSSPAIEPLEERQLLATFVVTNGGDVPLPGQTTLRQAILSANLSPGADTIAFNIPGVPTIHPLSPLPDVTGPTTIDGSTQPGYAGTPIVWLDGSSIVPIPLMPDDGLRFTGSGSTVNALAISGFDQIAPASAGIRLLGGGNDVVQNSYIGPDPTGAPPTAGNNDGIVIESSNNLITGDLISGNQLAGVRLSSGANNRVQASRIGTDAAGAIAFGNGLAGIVIESATGSLIGGNTAAQRNLISGNFGEGVAVQGGSGTVISGNYIGTDATGSAAVDNNGNGVNVTSGGTSDLLIGGTSAGAGNVISGNDGDGVRITDSSGVRVLGNFIGVDAAGNAAVPNQGSGVTVNGSVDDTAIGGTAAGAGNVLSGNNGDGISFNQTGTGNLAQGNIVGANAAANAAVPNQGNGISVNGDGVLIGGTSAAARNVISGNAGRGVQLANGSVVEFNLIGTAADGTTALGNGQDGVYIDGSDNQIGTTTAGNSIGYNGLNGVTVALNPLDLRNAIRGNNIFYNGGLGIDLGDDGVTPNDPQDPDPGPNNFQNFPVLTSVTLSGSTATISGTLNSTPNSTFALDFFASQIWDPTHFGEGQKYLGSATVTTDAAGNASFSVTVGGVPAGYNYFAATATDAAGNTSEFCYDPPASSTPAPTKHGKAKAKGRHAVLEDASPGPVFR